MPTMCENSLEKIVTVFIFVLSYRVPLRLSHHLCYVRSVYIIFQKKKRKCFLPCLCNILHCSFCSSFFLSFFFLHFLSITSVYVSLWSQSNANITHFNATIPFTLRPLSTFATEFLRLLHLSPVSSHLSHLPHRL